MLRRCVIVKEQVIVIIGRLWRLRGKSSGENWCIYSCTLRIPFHIIWIALDSCMRGRLLGHVVKNRLHSIYFAGKRRIRKEVQVACRCSCCRLGILLNKMASGI